MKKLNKTLLKINILKIVMIVTITIDLRCQQLRLHMYLMYEN